MEERPLIIIKPTLTDIILEMFGWLAMIALWGFAISNYSDLPLRVPVHFDAYGHVNGYGNKTSIYILPIIGALFFVLILVLSRYPHLFNYPVTITKANAEKQYRNGLRMIRYLKFFIASTFLIIEYQTIQAARGQSEGLGAWFFPLILGFIIIPVILAVVTSVRSK
jgi:uncharacterized membrane protein